MVCFSVDGGLCKTHLRKAKVQNLGMAILSNEDVGWFYVAMNDSLGVRSVQAVSHANRHIQQHLQFHGPTSDDVFQGRAF